jgi:hypothetical protein
MPFATSTIVADAFRFMELSPPSSFADDSEEAEAANSKYPDALSMCLEANDWSFASRYAELAELADLPEGEVADPRIPHAYALPGDLVKLREIVDAFARWRIDAEGLLRADVGERIMIRYTRRLDDEARLPATFRVAVAAQLAVLLSPRWNNVRTKREELRGILAEAMARSRRDDGMSGSPERYDDRPNHTGDDWVSGAMR